jgi:hypothetical protein
MKLPQVLYTAVPTMIDASSLMPVGVSVGGRPQLVTEPGSHDAVVVSPEVTTTGSFQLDVPAFQVHLPT